MRRAVSITPAELREWHDEYQMSAVVRAGPTLYLSGIAGVRPDGTVPENLEDEIELVFSQIDIMLREAGATMADIVALDSFHVTKDMMTDCLLFNKIRAKYMDAPHPAWTAIGASSLALPECRLEVRITAYLG